jgi:hypothetical protein
MHGQPANEAGVLWNRKHLLSRGRSFGTDYNQMVKGCCILGWEVAALMAYRNQIGYASENA